jgi:hypothetical protein
MRFLYAALAATLAVGCASSAGDIDAADQPLNESRQLEAICTGSHEEWRCWNDGRDCNTFNGSDLTLQVKLSATRSTSNEFTFGKPVAAQDTITVKTAPQVTEGGLVPSFETTRAVTLDENAAIATTTEGEQVKLHYESKVVTQRQDLESTQQWSCDFVWK